MSDSRHSSSSRRNQPPPLALKDDDADSSQEHEGDADAHPARLSKMQHHRAQATSSSPVLPTKAQDHPTDARVTKHAVASGTTKVGASSSNRSHVSPPPSSSSRKRRQLSESEKLKVREEGWSLSPIHSFESSIPIPAAFAAKVEVTKSTQTTTTKGPSSSTAPASLPAIPSPPHQGPRGASPRAPNAELMEAKILAALWIKEKQQQSITAAYENDSGRASPVDVERSRNAIRKTSLSPLLDRFVVTPAANGGLFETKNGYPVVPPYQDRIGMQGKLRTVPFRLHTPDHNRRHHSSPHTPRPATRERGSRSDQPSTLA